MNTDDDEIFFADEDEAESQLADSAAMPPWRILIVDDAKEIHDATRMVLSDVTFRGRPLEFLSAFSGTQAREVLLANTDIAVIFLDVVMEHDHAGLDLVEVIRRELKNEIVRIILRTGQPGQAPERDVIVKYDINDYKNKSELSVDKLFACLISALRAYQDLITIDASRRGLERILEGSTSLLQLRSTERFLSGVLLQMDAMFDLGADAMLCARKKNAKGAEIDIVTASGRYEKLGGKPLNPVDLGEGYDAILKAFESREGLFEPGKYVIYFHTQEVYECVIYICRGRTLNDFEKALINVFCATAAVGLSNIQTLETLEQKVAERTQALQLAYAELEEKAQELERVATTDSLTGVCTRRHFLQLAENSLRTAKRHHRPMTVAILDIDHFKMINDENGHAAGDQALRDFTQTCTKGLRQSDVFGRIGGEEFAIALPDTNAEGALMVAKRLQELLALANIPGAGGRPLTVSIGVAEWEAGDESVEATIQRSDGALYEAKRNGRNRVEIAGPGS